jgi:hypothetical protein
MKTLILAWVLCDYLDGMCDIGRGEKTLGEEKISRKLELSYLASVWYTQNKEKVD